MRAADVSIRFLFFICFHLDEAIFGILVLNKPKIVVVVSVGAKKSDDGKSYFFCHKLHMLFCMSLAAAVSEVIRYNL